MKRLISVGCIACLVLSAGVALAQGRGNGGPKVRPTGGAAKAGGAGAQGGAKTHGGPKAGKGGSQAATGTKATGPRGRSSETTTSATSNRGQTSATAAGTLSPVQQNLQGNANLAGKLESRLPAGTNLMNAAEGFKSLGQFVSAVNAAHHHELDFARLKTAILDEGMSLGQAMRDQRTSLDGTREASRAQREADALIRSTDPSESSRTETPTKARPGGTRQ